MELDKGTPITRCCDEHKLTPRQRLELFVPVCQAIQHAHQKGIIHRDIKPSNVVVALYDDRPVPKVIDLGVAKAAGIGYRRSGRVVGGNVLHGMQIPLRHATLQHQLRLRIGWYYEQRPHASLGGRAPNEGFFGSRRHIVGRVWNREYAGRAVRPAPDRRYWSPDSRESTSPWKFSATADSVPCRSSIYAMRPEPSSVWEALPRRMVRAGRHPKSNECIPPTPCPLAPSSCSLSRPNRRKKRGARLAGLPQGTRIRTWSKAKLRGQLDPDHFRTIFTFFLPIPGHPSP
jgi:hypothetical protein